MLDSPAAAKGEGDAVADEVDLRYLVLDLVNGKELVYF